jgi:uncharacterized protein with GYD domain
VDLARLQTLALEGTGLPFTSRIKDKLKGIMANQPAGFLPPVEGAAEQGAKSSKRGPKPVAAADATVSASGESWTARIAACGVEDCVSSDEEDAFEQQSAHAAVALQAQAQAATEGTEAVDVTMTALPPPAYAQDYPPFSPQTMAAPPDLVWPVKLLVVRRQPVTSSVSAKTAASCSIAPGVGVVPASAPLPAVSSAGPIAPAAELTARPNA